MYYKDDDFEDLYEENVELKSTMESIRKALHGYSDSDLVSLAETTYSISQQVGIYREENLALQDRVWKLETGLIKLAEIIRKL